MTHILKILPEYYNAIQHEGKNFEVRLNDRTFKVGDTLELIEHDPSRERADRRLGSYPPGLTGRSLKKTISYILPGGQFGIDEKYVVLGLRYVPTRCTADLLHTALSQLDLGKVTYDSFDDGSGSWVELSVRTSKLTFSFDNAGMRCTGVAAYKTKVIEELEQAWRENIDQGQPSDSAMMATTTPTDECEK